MNAFKKIQFAIALSAILSFGTAIAQDERDDATDVWILVERQWDANENGDDDWIDRMLMDSFFGWSKNTPAPRSVSSTRMWERFSNEQRSMVAHELYPLEIVVEGDTAVVHYLYSSAFEDKNGEVDVSHGRYTDVLVRTADGWKFLSWHGGDD